TSRKICAIRWTSPEAIFLSQYTSRSDVWSYGITLWEIYSLSELPFGNMNNIRLKPLLKNQSANLSHHLPQSTKYGFEKTYADIILPCLSYNVNLRPDFHDLIERVQTRAPRGTGRSHPVPSHPMGSMGCNSSEKCTMGWDGTELYFLTSHPMVLTIFRPIP
ncbi:unnamed protein product, partial [Rotaria magnacalcarata]